MNFTPSLDVVGTADPESPVAVTDSLPVDL
jgi:hypothetical protein